MKYEKQIKQNVPDSVKNLPQTLLTGLHFGRLKETQLVKRFVFDDMLTKMLLESEAKRLKFYPIRRGFHRKT